MDTLNDYIAEYNKQLKSGYIQKAYKGIMVFMSELKTYMENTNKDYAVSGLYTGFMDMTYFAVITPELKNKDLKTAVVYLHKENRFELWLCAKNRNLREKYIDFFRNKNICGYILSETNCDSIIEEILSQNSDFNHTEKLKKLIYEKNYEFIQNIISLTEI